MYRSATSKEIIFTAEGRLSITSPCHYVFTRHNARVNAQWGIMDTINIICLEVTDLTVTSLNGSNWLLTISYAVVYAMTVTEMKGLHCNPTVKMLLHETAYGKPYLQWLRWIAGEQSSVVSQIVSSSVLQIVVTVTIDRQGLERHNVSLWTCRSPVSRI